MLYVVSTRVRSGLVHGLSWTGLAAPTTPWQRATVRNPTVLHDTRLWCMARQTVKLWDGNHYVSFVKLCYAKYVVFKWVVTELVSEQRGPAFQFHSMLACATVITMDEDRGAAYAFFMMSPLTFDGTRRTVTLAAWLHDIEAIFRICHIQPHLQVSLASRCLAIDARLWWRTQGENEVQGGLWEDFRNAIIARFGPIREEDAGMHYRDPDIYRDINTARYLNYVYDWHSYPGESMGHYCRREGLPPKIREHVQPPALEMTLDHMINDILDTELAAHVIQADAMINDQGQEPVDNAGIKESHFQLGPELQEDPIPVVPLQEIPPQEEGIDAEAMDLEEFLENLELQEDPPEIVMDEEEEEQVNVEDDPDEIMFDEEDWEILQANEVPPQNNPVPPVAPQVPEVHQEIPLEPAGLQRNPPLIREDLLYERYRRMKAPEFEGTTDPIVADNWLIDIQVILDFMGLTEHEKVLCAFFALKKDARHWWRTVQIRRNVANMDWQDFVAEFRTMYYNGEILAVQQDEFTSFKQGSMSMVEAVNKFEQLGCLCPELVPNEKEKVRRMMKMFRTDISKQDKEARIQIFKAKKEEKANEKQLQPRQNQETNLKGQTSNSNQYSKQFRRNKRKGNAMGQGQQRNYPQKKNNRGNEGNNNNYPVCAQCGRKRLGVCRMGTNACYLCGKEGHYARNCTSNSQSQNPQYQNRNTNRQLHAMQAKI
nr:hypothetical protein TIFTF001_046371 [Ficus carica]GMN29748.1 hypothetical protein TIFTF001_046373 [Ficus carica]